MPSNIQKARDLARTTALAGDAEGMFLVYMAKLLDPELSYIENGKINNEKYNKLSKRTIKQRALDIEAYEMLARSAELKYTEAEFFLASVYYDTIGDGNNEKALQQYKNSKLSSPITPRLIKNLEFMKKLGKTRATYKLFSDAQFAAMMSAALKAYGIKKAQECQNIIILEIKNVSDIQNPVYLPVNKDGMRNAFLISGQWSEEWTYDVCGKTTDITITFIADGLHGARFVIH